ncbi:hypothetical protein HNR19_002334 [Nocardioides thalensis]|uniref:Aminoglycoside phosphotransferase domain-containing protein n=1 Tax=Nocardioides thalensis TaxID=1914755 RepID=A0A853C3P5_9ACTN|nr:phosphotransferase [Nocardioides thalensis]NYJ01636.1 hypothetical protein [Nocardioides thalensis]
MHDRAALGAADVPDDVLAGMVADLLGVDAVDLRSSVAVEFAYELPAITTAGRYSVSGTAVAAGESRSFALFVKHVHEWSRSPFFASVPEEMREMARAAVPWRTEAEVYASDLAGHLPDGLEMPRTLGVHEIDESSYAVWLEVVPTYDAAWDLARYRRAAHLMGRFAASGHVREVAASVSHPFTIRNYAEGRFKNQVLPMLQDDGIWQHPVVAGAFADLRDRMRSAAEGVDAVTDELLAMPHLAGHGDACPNNLLLTAGHDGFTLIDFGFFTLLPVGFDLGQLLVGDVQIGRRDATDLAERDATMLAAYRDGLAAEGVDVDPATLRRAHALHVALFTGLSALPFELLELEPTPEVHRVAADRAAITRFSLDMLDKTARSGEQLG